MIRSSGPAPAVIRPSSRSAGKPASTRTSASPIAARAPTLTAAPVLDKAAPVPMTAPVGRAASVAPTSANGQPGNGVLPPFHIHGLNVVLGLTLLAIRGFAAALLAGLSNVAGALGAVCGLYLYVELVHSAKST